MALPPQHVASSRALALFTAALHTADSEMRVSFLREAAAAMHHNVGVGGGTGSTPPSTTQSIAYVIDDLLATNASCPVCSSPRRLSEFGDALVKVCTEDDTILEALIALAAGCSGSACSTLLVHILRRIRVVTLQPNWICSKIERIEARVIALVASAATNERDSLVPVMCVCAAWCSVVPEAGPRLLRAMVALLHDQVFAITSVGASQSRDAASLVCRTGVQYLHAVLVACGHYCGIGDSDLQLAAHTVHDAAETLARESSKYVCVATLGVEFTTAARVLRREARDATVSVECCRLVQDFLFRQPASTAALRTASCALLNVRASTTLPLTGDASLVAAASTFAVLYRGALRARCRINRQCGTVDSVAKPPHGLRRVVDSMDTTVESACQEAGDDRVRRGTPSHTFRSCSSVLTNPIILHCVASFLVPQMVTRSLLAAEALQKVGTSNVVNRQPTTLMTSSSLLTTTIAWPRASVVKGSAADARRGARSLFRLSCLSRDAARFVAAEAPLWRAIGCAMFAIVTTPDAPRKIALAPADLCRKPRSDDAARAAATQLVSTIAEAVALATARVKPCALDDTLLLMCVCRGGNVSCGMVGQTKSVEFDHDWHDILRRRAQGAATRRANSSSELLVRQQIVGARALSERGRRDGQVTQGLVYGPSTWSTQALRLCPRCDCKEPAAYMNGLKGGLVAHMAALHVNDASHATVHEEDFN